MDEKGFCLCQKCVDEKTNEIRAIPELLDCLDIKGIIITTDAVGTQRETTKKIRRKGAIMCWRYRQTRGICWKMWDCFSDSEYLSKSAYKKTTEKARGSIEKREYWQTGDISWLSQKKEWTGLKTIIMTRSTVTGTEGEEHTEERYFISSLPLGIEEIVCAVRGHWMVESYHWHLDVTFREDGNHTLERQASYNLRKR